MASTVALVPPCPRETPAVTEADWPSGMLRPPKMPVLLWVPKSRKTVANIEALYGNEREYDTVAIFERLPSVSSEWIKPAPRLAFLSNGSWVLKLMRSSAIGGRALLYSPAA